MREDIFNRLYDRVNRGLPVVGTPRALAGRLLEETGTPANAADAAVSLATVLGGATGFVFGLPGFLLTPVTLPANVVGAAGIQLHMAATVAAIAGHDPDDPATRAACVACLERKVGREGRNEPEEEVAVRTGIKVAERLLRLAGESAAKGASWAARRVLLRQISRRIPGVGGLIGAGSDGLMTRHVGSCARRVFLGEGG
ncbi:MAG: EcsC family protein [Gemmatimonadota bacterium]